MKAHDAILNVWNQFNNFPMETLTKAWLYEQSGGPRQRTVPEMIEHRDEYGTSGNCFDLAIWLLHQLRGAGIKAHAIGRDLFTAEAHVAVIAYEGGKRYLCDLGDQWISPILIDSPTEESVEPLSGLFPGAKVQLHTTHSDCVVTYHRPSGKVSRQHYSLLDIDEEELLRAGQFSQRLLRKQLCEMRIPLETEIAHWEFYNWASFLSNSNGLYHDPPVHSADEWSDRIHTHTGIARQVIAQALEIYSRL